MSRGPISAALREAIRAAYRKEGSTLHSVAAALCVPKRRVESVVLHGLTLPADLDEPLKDWVLRQWGNAAEYDPSMSRLERMALKEP